MKQRKWVHGAMLAAAVAMSGALAPVARAEDADDSDTSAQEQAAQGSAPDADPQPLPWQLGPTHVDLGHDLGIDLPDGYMYLPPDASARVLERMGNFHNDDVLGLAASTRDEADWLVVISYDAEGHVKDDEAVDAEALLGELREGLDDFNEERAERGFDALALDGWAEAPRYDRSQHHLVWALTVSSKSGTSVNYNTRVLGRHGYASLNLVTSPETLDADKASAEALLSHTSFRTGARYEDFDAASDKTAEYGLAGLIAAGAGLGAGKLLKIGLLAKFWKLIVVGFVAGKKLIVLGIAAGAAYVKKLLGARKNEAPS